MASAAPRLLNLTPHTVSVWPVDDSNGSQVTHFEPFSEKPVRVGEEPGPDDVDNTVLYQIRIRAPTVFTGVVQGLPVDEDDGQTGIIVSMLTAQAIVEHPDLWRGPVLVPDTGSTCVRVDGQIKGVRALLIYKAATRKREREGEEL